ncbi:Methyltransferase Ppm1/Ppm2/Tcmp [Dillenia turbinata]|uniref:Methyltransferase Ppm1/Ppm2/Tcmp n=1 Tax=Dillenia turbinata TaxID=194707 RepID=A0AAN8VVF7_9MAGN
MFCLVGSSPPTFNLRLSPHFTRIKNGRGLKVKLKLNYQAENDPLLQIAIHNASLRFQETLHPLFVDQYAGCFAPPDFKVGLQSCSDHYRLATKFIDDKLLSMLSTNDELRQVVLLTDGMDTRPYRLRWPPSTIIFDASPERVFQTAAQKLDDAGARIPRSCMFIHVPLESCDMQHVLCSKGLNGNRPSIWALQGLPLRTLVNFEEMLYVVSSLAVKGSLFIGELPVWPKEAEVGMKSNTKTWMNQLFMRNGFKVETVSYDNVAMSLGEKLTLGDHESILFVAEHLRFSDAQMDSWRREFQRIEEEGDEEGFEEL